MLKNPLFILAGNGSYENKGCEAIVRGTAEIIRQYFDNPKFVVFSHFQSDRQFEEQKANETDKSIIHQKVLMPQRYTPSWFFQKGLQVLNHKWRFYSIYKEIEPYFKNCVAVLSVGGDNYSLDYGKPTVYTDLDDFVLSKEISMIIWGASVGPFNKIPDYEKYMIKHLKKINGIFVRESMTLEYLTNLGIKENVYRVADPAFLLKPIKPQEEKFNIEIPKEAIGINLSPLMARYRTNSNLAKWIEDSATMIAEILKEIQRPIFLIPHVISPHSNDYAFLKNVLAHLKGTGEEVKLVPPILTAAELKWIIGKMDVFVGARTHSTIAAISSGIPTLSLSYSIKSKGINKNIFGHTTYCMDIKELDPATLIREIKYLLTKKEEIKSQINSALPKIKKLALESGRYLREII